MLGICQGLLTDIVFLVKIVGRFWMVIGLTMA